MANSIAHLTADNFDDVVSERSSPVLVDFWAPWCAPCRALSPEFEAAARAFEGRVRFAKVNVDEAPALADRYGVRSIPHLVLFRDGRPVQMLTGFADRKRLEGFLETPRVTPRIS